MSLPIAGEHFGKPLQFQDLAIKKILSLLLLAYFCEQNLELVEYAFFINIENKIKIFSRKKSFSVFE